MVTYEELKTASPPFGSFSTSHLNLRNKPICNTNAFIMDGSIVAVFKIEGMLAPLIDEFLKLSEKGFALQIYRVRENFKEQFYIAVTIIIDYSMLQFSWLDTFKNILNPDIYIERLDQYTKNRCESILRVLLDKKCIPDTTICDKIAADSICKSNVSFLKINESTIGSVFSLHNLDEISIKSMHILKEFDFIQLYTIVVPLDAQQQHMTNRMARNLEMLASLKSTSENEERARVDTFNYEGTVAEYMQTLKGLCLINSSFLVYGESFEEVRNKSKGMIGILNSAEICEYQYSNMSRWQFLSLFPGNAFSGKHFYSSSYDFARINSTITLAV